MDMKKILQAMDGASTKPVEGASDMKKFVSIIQEGANPHKVTLPVQMAMQHYQQAAPVKKSRPALIDKYFSQVEDEHLQEKANKRQLINQYASVIAERVMMRESKGGDYVPPKEADYGPDYQDMVKRVAAQEKRKQNKQQPKNENIGNPPDVVSVDIPLLIRLLEYAREDAKTDMDLHNVAENMINLSASGSVLSMDDYNKIVPSDDMDQALPEGRKIKPKKKTDPCWSDYKQVGMKKKGGKMVPNCVPKKPQE